MSQLALNLRDPFFGTPCILLNIESPPDYTGCERDAGGEEEVPQVCLGVEVGDGHTQVGPGVVAGEGGLLQAELSDPGSAVNTGRVATALHIHQQDGLVFGGARPQALRLPRPGLQPVVLLEVGVLHYDVMAGEDVPGAALATTGPTAVTQTCRINVTSCQRTDVIGNSQTSK